MYDMILDSMGGFREIAGTQSLTAHALMHHTLQQAQPQRLARALPTQRKSASPQDGHTQLSWRVRLFAPICAGTPDPQAPSDAEHAETHLHWPLLSVLCHGKFELETLRTPT